MSAPALTKADYGNLANLVARATYNGVQEASAGVVLFSKLQALANEPDKATEGKDGNDSAGGA